MDIIDCGTNIDDLAIAIGAISVGTDETLNFNSCSSATTMV